MTWVGGAFLAFAGLERFNPAPKPALKALSAMRYTRFLALTAILSCEAATTAGAPDPLSQAQYRLPFADGTRVKVFDDFQTHQPRGRVDLYAVGGTQPYRVVAAADGRVMAIQDGYSEQQSGRAAALCHNNYVWIAHPNGEWSNYSHIAHGSVTAGQYIGDEDAIGCAMLKHVHFEVAVPEANMPIDQGGFLTDNDGGKRERNPRFCAVPGGQVKKDAEYVAKSC